jgi:hypothetical protein
VKRCVELITAKGEDITGGYEQWLEIGFALANTFGESGRDIYHSISVFSNEYGKGRSPDEQYSYCLRSKSKDRAIGIGTFFKYCADRGIRFTE